MANNEQSFADRLGRADTLVAAITSANPAFLPADETLIPVTFTEFVSALDVINGAANEANVSYSMAVRERVAMVKDLKERALRAFRYVRSNQAWDDHAGSIKPAYDKLRNNKAKTARLPSGGTEGEGSKVSKNGEQSFADLDSLFMKFVVGLSRIAGYNPPAAELSLANLQTLNADFSALNKSMADLAVTASLKIQGRQAGFADLKAKAKAIKDATSSQYGMKSGIYKSIKGLRF